MEGDLRRRLFLCLFLTWTVLVAGSRTAIVPCTNGSAAPLRRSCFPAGFVFGSSTSAYQLEGAAREDGRGPSMWDAFTHRHPEKIADGKNGDVAIDFYHRYKEDLKMAKDMGLDAYRFSISWSRILPDGKGQINGEGIAYYKSLIDEILSRGLLPFATIFHWDAPQGLEDEYGGFLSPSIVDDFRGYAEVCFREFGDRVKHWITLNEPWNFCSSGYATGICAPGRCSPWEKGKCSEGDSSTEPYIAGHHMLLAHAAAVKLYREKYQGSQQGTIGISLSAKWFVPLTESKPDVEATGRALDFIFGWFMDPLARGEYPQSMKTLVGDRLPEFTEEQSAALRGSFDFLGINYYTAKYVHEAPPSERPSCTTDARAIETGERNGVPIGPESPIKGVHIYPQGIKDLLLHMKERYNDPVIFVTENGVGEISNSTMSLEEYLNDGVRVDYHHQHLVKILEAISEGVDVKGYFAWSLFDVFEWNFGYTRRYGLVYVDFNKGLKRYRKRSANWFQETLTGGQVEMMIAAAPFKQE